MTKTVMSNRTFRQFDECGDTFLTEGLYTEEKLVAGINYLLFRYCCLVYLFLMINS
jgi:hypothetical protein